MRRSSFNVIYRRHETWEGNGYEGTRYVARFEKNGKAVNLLLEILDKLLAMQPGDELDGKRIRVTLSVLDD